MPALISGVLGDFFEIGKTLQPGGETLCATAFQSRRVRDVATTALEGHRTPDDQTVTEIRVCA